jgi:hypothetical protein
MSRGIHLASAKVSRCGLDPSWWTPSLCGLRAVDVPRSRPNPRPTDGRRCARRRVWGAAFRMKLPQRYDPESSWCAYRISWETSGRLRRSRRAGGPVFEHLRERERARRGCIAGSPVSIGVPQSSEYFSIRKMKNPSTNRGVRWSGKRDLKDLHGE